MGMMKVLVVLLVLFNFCFPASFASLANNLNTGNPPEKLKDKQTDESTRSLTVGSSGNLNQNKSVHPVARGGGGGEEGGEEGGGVSIGGGEEGGEEGGGMSSGGGEEGDEEGGGMSSGRAGGEDEDDDGGQSSSTPRGGGVTVIPVDAAGGNNYNGAGGICSWCRKDMLVIDVVIAFTSVLLCV